MPLSRAQLRATQIPTHGPATDRFTGKTGAQIFHDLMVEHQVEAIFGYPGGAILPVFDAIYGSEQFNFILSRHEQGAGHMAEGYARVTGKPGVVLVTSGPGATNTVTPMQDALMDGTPLVVFAGQVATGAIGTDAFQEADMTGITRPCTKWNTLVKRVEDIPRAINTAFHVATTGRPGPVFVDLPKDVTAAILNGTCHPDPFLPGYHIREAGTSSEIERAAKLINIARKPVLYVGQGAILSGATDVLRQCAEKAGIPVTTSLLGLGAFDETHDLSLHMLGMHGAAYANWAMRDADLIISVGARFDDRVTGKIASFAPGARAAEREGRGGIIHFDIAPEQINKAVPVTIGVEGDARKNLELLLPLLENADRSDWLQQCQTWKREQPFRYDLDEREFHLKPQAVIEELNKQTDSNAIITTGVGQHQMWAAQFYQYRTPRQWLSSGGLGTMGFGVPSSVGAAIGEKILAQHENRPPRHVINIDGDGSFSMTAMEMVTAAQYGIHAKTIILNNDFQGMVKQWQDLFYDERYSHTEMHNPDFVALTDAMNCKGFRVTKLADLPSVMAEFLAHDGPAVLDALVEKHEHVYPMVPAGKTVDDMVLGPKS
ncbi:biosynthetic-type acetolactate synthase large subunit [Mucisphaera calidilacus]|uniref:Acetolactate synthase n=1 Tax=Mucisphaera calidilacus TaxID=2527982 RepID=A0A518BTM3_9BACT|nr:biosynthetic-type acetolactate synthase large subunit [Mucisphaera calidilacus]QDU70321.1 Acetolactate synthase large subunit [Mucisphaera calidilacus]